MTLQLLPIKKPEKSKIKLTKSRSSLLIRIPSVGFKPYLLSVMVFVAFWDGFVILWTVCACRAPFPMQIDLKLVSIKMVMEVA
jgi:hypothetical protein